MRPRRWWVVLASVLVISGCGKVDRGPAAGPEKPKPTAGTTEFLEHGSLENPVGAVGDLNGLTCRPNGRGVWTASGTIRNPTAATATYQVSVSIVRTATSEVISRREQEMPVKAKESRRFSFAGLEGSSKKGDKVSCVPRVLRGS